GYEKCYSAEDIDGLNRILTEITSDDVGPIFLEVKCAIGARADLGRPTTSAKENKDAFMKLLLGRA
ncbi:MAG: phosphonopyruvate decarboxylase, partial [Eubacterium sp.]|nr:phosphonopyruvate decarboxylase [Eubacterium sp.]